MTTNIFILYERMRDAQSQQGEILREPDGGPIRIRLGIGDDQIRTDIAQQIKGLKDDLSELTPPESKSLPNHARHHPESL